MDVRNDYRGGVILISYLVGTLTIAVDTERELPPTAIRAARDSRQERKFTSDFAAIFDSLRATWLECSQLALTVQTALP